MLKGISLFSGAGISELFIDSLGLQVECANEKVVRRSNLYSSVYKNSHMIPGDVLKKDIFNQIRLASSSKVDFILASPPCQGMSMAGKNRNIDSMSKDERNYLIYRVVDLIKDKNPEFVLIENVPLLIKLHLPYKNKLRNICDILLDEFGEDYRIECDILDASDYGIPQVRKRAFLRIFKKDLKWELPSVSDRVTVEEAIGFLPSLESGEFSNIKWHYARTHSPSHIEWMRYTPTGESAFKNNIHYPRKANGEIIKGYDTSYRRIRWDLPAPTITIRNDAISSQRNVHPGRPLKDGTYSDARVLTPLELMILSSIPENWNIPPDTPEVLIRQSIGECVPPLFTKKILSGIL